MDGRGRDTRGVTAHADHHTRPEPPENLSTLLQRVFAEHSELTQKGVGERAGIPLATLNAWVTGYRGAAGRIKPETLRALAKALPPEYTVARVYAAAGRRMPGPSNAELRERLIGIFEELTDRQQMALIEIADAIRRTN
jgi:transcriptional regulator with XRE-family HTH domain